MNLWGLIALQVWLGGSWGMPGPSWRTHGTQLRKTSAINAPRALVMVFNGADGRDFPYQIDNPRAADWTDSLLSPCLNTEGAPVIYVHFAYQRGGLMEAPESNDTLRLWGLRKDGFWQVLWDTVGTGQADTVFWERTLRLEDTLWQHECFRLRWAAYGSTYGAYDNWLLAYTAVTADTLLEGIYWRSIPRTYWGRYGIVPAYLAEQIQDSLLTTITGLPGTQVLLIHRRPDDTLTQQITLQGGVTEVQWPSLRGPFPDTLSRIEMLYQASPTNELWPDTTAVGPWIGYDDGEMEQGYGLSVANRAFIQVFELDTLVALDRVAIQFFPMPTQVGKPFQLSVWLLDESTEPIYLRFHRVSLDSTGGGFVEYPLDTVLWVKGRVGIGFIQADNQPLGVGWDGSYEGAVVVYRDSGGVWVPSRKQGCLMVRLGLIPQRLLGLKSEQTQTPGWWLAPVPVSAGAMVQVGGQYTGEFSLWNPQGVLLGKISGRTFQAPSEAGLYFVKDNQGRTRKLLVLP